MVFSCSIYMCHKIIFGIFEGMKKKRATNTTNSIRTHATGVRFSSYQFVVFFMLIYLPKVHSRLCGFFVAYEILKVRLSRQSNDNFAQFISVRYQFLDLQFRLIPESIIQRTLEGFPGCIAYIFVKFVPFGGYMTFPDCIKKIFSI